MLVQCRIRSALVAMAMAIPVLAGCDDTSVQPVMTLSARQSQQVITALLEEVAAATTAEAGQGALVSGEERSADGISFDAVCSGGGRIRGSGDAWTALSPNGTGTLSVDLHYTPESCVVDIDGMSLIIDGDPSLTYQWAASYVNNVLVGEIEFHGRGSIRWAGDHTGACLLDYTITVPAGGTGYMHGVMCNQDIGGPL